MLPKGLNTGWFLKFDLTGDDEIVLEPNRCYAFVLLFTERAKDRSMALANCSFGSYKPDKANRLVGHGIRRKGKSGNPKPPFFRPDLSGNLNAGPARPPGTLGFPDVCAWRDLCFTITAIPRSTFRAVTIFAAIRADSPSQKAPIDGLRLAADDARTGSTLLFECIDLWQRPGIWYSELPSSK